MTRTEDNAIIVNYLHAAQHGEHATIGRLNEGFNPTDKLPDFRLSSALHLAMLNTDETNLKTTIAAILEKFPDADLKKDRDGNTPLHVAVQLGNQEAMKAIYEAMQAKGRSFEKFNNRGRSPLHIAAANNDMVAMKYLIDTVGIPYNCASKNRLSAKLLPVEVAAASSSMNTLDDLLNRHNKNELANTGKPYDMKRAIQTAYKKGNIEVAAKLLAEGGDVAHLYTLRKLPPKSKEFKNSVKSSFRTLMSYIEMGDCDSTTKHLNEIDQKENGAAIKSAVLNMHDQQHPMKHLLNAAYIRDKPDIFAVLEKAGASTEIGRDYSLEMKKSNRPRFSKISGTKSESRTLRQQYSRNGGTHYRDYLLRIKDPERTFGANITTTQDMTPGGDLLLEQDGGEIGGAAKLESAKLQPLETQNGHGADPKKLPPLKVSSTRVNRVAPANLSQSNSGRDR